MSIGEFENKIPPAGGVPGALPPKSILQLLLHSCLTTVIAVTTVVVVTTVVAVTTVPAPNNRGFQMGGPLPYSGGIVTSRYLTDDLALCFALKLRNAYIRINLVELPLIMAPSEVYSDLDYLHILQKMASHKK